MNQTCRDVLPGETIPCLPMSPLQPQKSRAKQSCGYRMILSKRKRRRWIVVGIGGFLALLLAAMWPAYRRYCQWSRGEDERIARSTLAAGDYVEARRLAQKLLREDYNNQAALKVLHAAMTAQKDPKAVEFAPALAANPANAPQTRLDGFREVCANFPLASVFRSWLTLPDGDRKRPGFLTAFVTRLIEQGLSGEAEELLRQSPETPRDPELQLLQARCWLGKGTSDQFIRAQQKIAELMERGGNTALPAFRLLSQIPLDQFRSGYFMEIDPWLQEQPGAVPADLLLARIQQLQRFPAEKARIVAEAVESHRASDPLACARWLRGLGMAREALALEADIHSPEWGATKADLLADLGLWAELEDWLSTQPAGLTRIDLCTRRAVAAEKRGDPARSRSLWPIILREAGTVKSSNVLLDVAAQTHAAGLEEMSHEAMLGALMLRRGRLPFWNGVRSLVPWLRKADRGNELIALCQIMAEIDFTTPEPRLEVLDLSNLLRTLEPAASLGQLNELAKRHPKLTSDPRYHEVRATILLGDGKPDEALDALNDPRQTIRLTTPRRTAVSAFAQAALALPPPSAEVLRKAISWRDMIGEERSFFTNLLETRFAKAVVLPPSPPLPPAVTEGAATRQR